MHSSLRSQIKWNRIPEWCSHLQNTGFLVTKKRVFAQTYTLKDLSAYENAGR